MFSEFGAPIIEGFDNNNNTHEPCHNCYMEGSTIMRPINDESMLINLRSLKKKILNHEGTRRDNDNNNNNNNNTTNVSTIQFGC